MKLYERLPDCVFVDGKRYRMNFDFRNVLRMIEVLDRNDLMPEAKAYNALHCVCKRPKNVFKVLGAVKSLLFTGSRKTSPRVTDFTQDAGLIRAAFRQAYGIDLYRDKLHWFEFQELMSALPNDTRYSEVVSIRAKPIPAPTKFNQHEREWLMRAKADVALEMTEDEQKEQYQQDVGQLAAFLLGMAEGGE